MAGSAIGAACFFFPFSEWRTKKIPKGSGHAAALWAAIPPAAAGTAQDAAEAAQRQAFLKWTQGEAMTAQEKQLVDDLWNTDPAKASEYWAAGEFLDTEVPGASSLDGGGLDGTMKSEAAASPTGQRTPFDYLQDGKGWEEEAASFSDEIVKVELPRGKYPEAEKHMEDAIKNGHPSVLTIQRGGARTNRKKSLRNIDKIPGMDLDEYPPAMFSEGGAGASVRLINRHDNRGAGSAIGNQLRRYPNGTKVKITFID